MLSSHHRLKMMEIIYSLETTFVTAESVIKYRISTNFFNTFSQQSALGLPVYNPLLECASTNDELHVPLVSRAKIKKWSKEREVMPSERERCTFLERPLMASFPKRKPYVLCLSPPHLRTHFFLIAMALSDLTVIDFDQPFKLDAALAMQAHPFFAFLLQKVSSIGPDNLHAWQEAHADTLEQFGARP
ncbi:hypothetical protein H4582DRAFT_2068139 [Lactarius indigo]|nr:hypothetical protein H4582DRAFT_2068139 [Lactarius indigo]